jgi:hypothetical protein
MKVRRRLARRVEGKARRTIRSARWLRSIGLGAVALPLRHFCRLEFGRDLPPSRVCPTCGAVACACGVRA